MAVHACRTPATNNALNASSRRASRTRLLIRVQALRSKSGQSALRLEQPRLEWGRFRSRELRQPTSTSVSYVAAGTTERWRLPGNSNALLNNNSYVTTLTDSAAQTFTFGGLTPGVQYGLYAIMNSNWTSSTEPGIAARATTFTVNGISQTVTTQTGFATVGVTAPQVYTDFGALTPSAGSLTINAIAPEIGGNGNLYNNTWETDVNGFQLVPISQVSLNTNIVANATSTLNVGTANAAVTLGTLTLSTTANPTLTLAGAGNFTFSGGGGSAISAIGPSGAAAINGSSPIVIASGSVNVAAGASLSIGATIQDGTAPRRSTRSAAAA